MGWKWKGWLGPVALTAAPWLSVDCGKVLTVCGACVVRATGQ